MSAGTRVAGLANRVRGVRRKDAMDEIQLKASKREIVGKQVNALRREGKLPAVIYGRRLASFPIWLDMKEASRIIDRVSSSALISLNVDGDNHYVLIREKQRNPLLGTLRHVDFQAVSLTEKVRASVRIVPTGEAPAVDAYFGILVYSLEQLEVECLPRDLPERIEVDISGLSEISDAIHVRDLVLPSAVQVLSDPDEMVVVVTAPVIEAVPEAEEEAPVEAAEPELIERGRREEEEEGEAE
jgi:large subunit ribosomal protein L25